MWTYLVNSEDSISSQASEDSPSPWLRGCSRSPTVKSSPTLPLSFFLRLRGETYQQRQSGTMCGHSPETCSPRSTSSTAGSPAKTSALPELERVWRESEALYSLRYAGSQQSLDLPLSCWKTSQALKSLCLESGPSLRRLGSLAAMGSYLPRKSEQITSGCDGGYWPTPRAADGDKGVRTWGGAMKERERRKNGVDLCTAVRFATPQSRDYRTGEAQRWESAERTRNLNDQIGGRLNPEFVEWLMGYRLGHTALEPWVIPWYRSKRAELLKSLRESEAA